MVVNLQYAKKFLKHFKERIIPYPNLRLHFDSRIDIFRNNPYYPLLRDHALKGSQKGLRAFSVTGDIRVIYRIVDSNTIQLLDIGTHNQVYR